MSHMSPAAVREVVELTFTLPRPQAVALLLDAYSRDNLAGERTADSLFGRNSPEPKRVRINDMAEAAWRMRCQHETPNDAFLAFMAEYRNRGCWPWERSG